MSTPDRPLGLEAIEQKVTPRGTQIENESGVPTVDSVTEKLRAFVDDPNAPDGQKAGLLRFIEGLIPPPKNQT